MSKLEASRSWVMEQIPVWRDADKENAEDWNRALATYGDTRETDQAMRLGEMKLRAQSSEDWKHVWYWAREGALFLGCSDKRDLLDHVMPEWVRRFGELLNQYGPSSDICKSWSGTNYGLFWGIGSRSEWPEGPDYGAEGVRWSKDGWFVFSPRNFHGGPVRQAGLYLKDLQVTGVEKMEVGDLESVIVGGGGVQWSEEIVNDRDNPLPISQTTETESTSEKQEEHSFQVAVSAEYRTRYRTEARASGNIAGFEASAESEFEQELTLRAEAQTAHEWRTSKTLRQLVQRTTDYEIPAHTRFTMIADRTERDLHQDVFVTGSLQARVGLDSYCFEWREFERLQDFYDVLRGINTDGGRWSRWFSQGGRGIPEHILAGLPVPKVRLNLPIKGNRVSYSRLTLKDTPLAGGEEQVRSIADDRLYDDD